MAHYDNPYAGVGIPSINNGMMDSVESDIGHAAGQAAKKVGKGVLHAGDAGIRGLGRGGIEAGKLGLSGIMGLGRAGIAGTYILGKNTWNSLHSPIGLYNPIGMAAKKSYDFHTSLVEVEEPHKVWNATKGALEDKGFNMKLTGKGKALAIGMGLIASAISGSKASEQKHMGQIDSKVYTNTPDFQVREYSQNLTYGGATGDLVFALFANRHGHRY